MTLLCVLRISFIVQVCTALGIFLVARDCFTARIAVAVMTAAFRSDSDKQQAI